jgi:hypothetical protein
MAKQVADAEKEAAAIIVTDVSHTDAMKRAGELRCKVKKSRCDAEHIRKALKRGYDEGGRAINGVAKLVNDPCERLEAELLEKENFSAIQAKKAQEERSSARRGECNEAGIPVADYYSQIENFAAEQWTAFVQGLKDAQAAAKQRAADQAWAEEQARKREANLQAENKRLADDAAEANRKRLAAESSARIAKFVADKKAAEEKAAAQKVLDDAKAESDRLAAVARAESQRLIDDANAAKLKAERDAQALRDAEVRKEKEAAAESAKVKAAADAEAKRIRDEAQAKVDAANAQVRKERDRIEAEAVAAKLKREAEAKRAAEAPDIENLWAYIDALTAVPTPAMKTERGSQILTGIINAIAAYSAQVEGMK